MEKKCIHNPFALGDTALCIGHGAVPVYLGTYNHYHEITSDLANRPKLIQEVLVRHGGHARHSNPIRHGGDLIRHGRTPTNQSEVSEFLVEITKNLSFADCSSFRTTKTKRTHSRGLKGHDSNAEALNNILFKSSQDSNIEE